MPGILLRPKAVAHGPGSGHREEILVLFLHRSGQANVISMVERIGRSAAILKDCGERSGLVMG